MPDNLDPLRVFLTSFAISSLGGLAALLRNNKPIDTRKIVSAMLYSGLMGLIIALLWYKYFDGQGNTYFLLGVSGLAGIGGTTAVDFIIQVIKKGGVHIEINPGDGSDKKPDPQEQDDDDEDQKS